MQKAESIQNRSCQFSSGKYYIYQIWKPWNIPNAVTPGYSPQVYGLHVHGFMEAH